MKSTIDTVLFDIDGVLILSKEANEKFYRDLLRFAGYPDPPQEAFSDFFHRTAWDNIARMTGETDEKNIRRVWEMLDKVEYSPHLLKIPPGAHHTIKTLKKAQYHTGLVTSRVKSGVENFYEAFGMQHYFDTVVTAEDCTHPKPHPEPIERALQNLKKKPPSAVYVGDSLSDQQSARAAGVFFIAFQNPTLEADVTIESFAELVGSIARLRLKED